VSRVVVRQRPENAGLWSACSCQIVHVFNRDDAPNWDCDKDGSPAAGIFQPAPAVVGLSWYTLPTIPVQIPEPLSNRCDSSHTRYKDDEGKRERMDTSNTLSTLVYPFIQIVLAGKTIISQFLS